GTQTYWVDPDGNYHSSLPSSIASSAPTSVNNSDRTRPGMGLLGSSMSKAGYGTTTGNGTTIPDGWRQVTGSLTPKYTATTTLSPSQQAIFDRSQQAQGNLAQIAQDQSAFLQNYLSSGIDTSGLPGLQSSYGPGYNTNFNGNLGLVQNAGLNTNFNGNLGLQTALGDGYATTYAGADDFSADRR